MAIVFVMLIAVVTLQASAAEAKRRVDPTTLQPTSDRVIFIKDAPNGGELQGNGLGTDADNPFIPIEHNNYNPDAATPEKYLQTAFYQATEMLGQTGGTIVICGPVTLGENESYGTGPDTKDTYTYNWGSKIVIKFTSVYNGVDYRETNGAKLTIQTPAELTVRGSSMWENIDIETDGSNRVISFCSFPTLVGQGVKTYPSKEDYADSAMQYISLAGGHRYAKGDNQIPTLTVQSGTYNKIAAGLWGVATDRGMNNATSYLTLEGTTKVLGSISGTVGKNSLYSGHVNITINGGTYECDIYGVGTTGMTNEDGTVDLVINGGDFKNAWSINHMAETRANYAPMYSILDFSGFTGDKMALASAFAIVTEGFNEIKLPEGVTQEELVELALQIEKDKETETEEQDETSVPDADDTTKAPDGEDATKAPVTTAKPDTTSPETTDPANDGGNGDMTLWIIIGVVAVVVVAAVVAVVLIKKKAAK